MRPKLVILDEPTSLLDPETATELVERVGKLRRELGTTFVVVEHRLDLVARVADRMVVMSQGKKVLEGTPREVLLGDEAEGYGISVPAVTRLQKLLEKDGALKVEGLLGAEELAAEVRRR